MVNGDGKCHIGGDKETGDVISSAFGGSWSTWRLWQDVCSEGFGLVALEVLAWWLWNCHGLPWSFG